MHTHIIYLGLGANVGNREGNINKALELLKEKVEIIQVAPFYETEPWGYEQQEKFINSALKGATNLSPQELLIFVKEIEKKLGRIKRQRNGPREIDIDILYYDDVTLDLLDLKIPHPLIHEREFVLKPLRDLRRD
jgi:2-amino-4-hydroxy-6-hydroxymethyldihydropteridine diphosphokinase